ncbi:polysaccharide deacetylase family protein [Pontibacter fetidus]|uniref:Polysaccharide deacetylase family protein n=1 Tax=Pontibacter fetidus TaxID=2700082 RepID=A0A6B2H0K6_9BACT|nr:polysaccharide deacetylase family protein [Pontibacter fetidus]NDK55851.1 polysaccharide deacetylase family protein [Pontibacter fetidus]
MKTTLRKAIHQVDVMMAPLILSAVKEQNALNTYLFHALFRDEEELALNCCDPQQQVTVDTFRRFVAYHKSKGYTFVSPVDVLKGLDPDERYVMITFDDGYYNNLRALPILEEFNVPALFFISANHVRKGKAFWWDVAYREGKKAGMSDAAIDLEKEHLLTLTDDAIDSYLTRKYGPACFTPIGETDRPLTPDELNKFAQHPLVHIGNHTCDHAVLPNYNAAGIKEQIAKAQDILEDIVGYRPITIAYPCGEFNDTVLKVCREENIKLGITTQHAKNFSPQLYEPTNLLTLNRFTIWGKEDLISQCDFYRSDFHVLDKMKGMIKRLKAKV